MRAQFERPEDAPAAEPPAGRSGKGKGKAVVDVDRDGGNGGEGGVANGWQDPAANDAEELYGE